MMFASLETHCRLAPRGARAVVTNRGAAFATAVRVIAGVHDGTTAAGANAHVALAASLAQVDVLVAMSTPHEIDYTLTFDSATLTPAE